MPLEKMWCRDSENPGLSPPDSSVKQPMPEQTEGRSYVTRSGRVSHYGWTCREKKRKDEKEKKKKKSSAIRGKIMC